MDGTWTIDELAERAAAALAADGSAQVSGRVRDLPNTRLIRWYTTIGLVDPPLGRRGRVALYGPRHLLQLVAVKRRQAEGRSIAEIQVELAAAPDETLAHIAALPHPAGMPATNSARRPADPSDTSAAAPGQPNAPTHRSIGPTGASDNSHNAPGKPSSAPSGSTKQSVDPTHNSANPASASARPRNATAGPSGPTAQPAGSAERSADGSAAPPGGSGSAASGLAGRPDDAAGDAGRRVPPGGGVAATDRPAVPGATDAAAADESADAADSGAPAGGSLGTAAGPAGGAGRGDFWSVRPDISYGQASVSAAYGRPLPPVVQGVRLAAGLTLLLDGPALNDDDLAAIDSAARPLLDELHRRGLLTPAESPASPPEAHSRRSP